MKEKREKYCLKSEFKLTKSEYLKLYPTGSSFGKLCGTVNTVKLHKMFKGDSLDKLLLRPIISNLGTSAH